MRFLRLFTAFIIACSAPLQVLAAATPCEPSHHTHDVDTHHHDGGQPEQQKVHGCGSCLACCAGGAIAADASIYLADSPPGVIAGAAPSPQPSSPPFRLDRPPQ